MRVLHLASFDRWSGAVGPAFAETEALRLAGVEAWFGYVGGYKLERKLRDVDFALPILRRGHGPAAAWRSVAAIRREIRRLQIDILHAHLSWDHQLAWFAARGDVRLVRTYHAARSVRRHLLAATGSVAVANAALANEPLFRSRAVAFTPSPIDSRIFRPDGARIELRHPVLGIIGKLDPGRGFEDAIHAAARLPGATLLIIGEGPHQPALQKLAGELGLEGRVVFAGYHEDDLPEHYRAMDLLLFTGRGSDEGYRALGEAMACGVPPLSYPFGGVEAIIGTALAADALCAQTSVEELASRAAEMLGKRETLGRLAVTEAKRFDLDATAARLVNLYTSDRIPAACG